MINGTGEYNIKVQNTRGGSLIGNNLNSEKRNCIYVMLNVFYFSYYKAPILVQSLMIDDTSKQLISLSINNNFHTITVSFYKSLVVFPGFRQPISTPYLTYRYSNNRPPPLLFVWQITYTNIYIFISKLILLLLNSILISHLIFWFFDNFIFLYRIIAINTKLFGSNFNDYHINTLCGLEFIIASKPSAIKIYSIPSVPTQGIKNS